MQNLFLLLSVTSLPNGSVILRRLFPPPSLKTRRVEKRVRRGIFPSHFLRHKFVFSFFCPVFNQASLSFKASWHIIKRPIFIFESTLWQVRVRILPWSFTTKKKINWNRFHFCPLPSRAPLCIIHRSGPPSLPPSGPQITYPPIYWRGFKRVFRRRQRTQATQGRCIRGKLSPRRHEREYGRRRTKDRHRLSKDRLKAKGEMFIWEELWGLTPPRGSTMEAMICADLLVLLIFQFST